MSKVYGKLFIYLFLLSSISSAQLSIKVNAETGFYNSKGNSLLEETDLLTRLESRLTYKYNDDKSAASIQLKARPEFYALDNNLTSFKFRGSGNYLRREDNFNWGINLTRHLNNISGNNLNIDYDIFMLQGDVTLFSIKQFPITANIGYAYQSVSSIDKQDLDLIFGEIKLNQIFSSYFRTGYGIYVENFSIENSSSSVNSETPTTNSGYRFGPAVEVHYLQDYIINLRYRFLFHSSNETEFPSYEQWIRLVAGKILFPKFSVFILIDFYSRKFKNINSSTERLPILYKPLNQENHISFKASYDLSKSYEIYFKSGYFNEDLIYNNFEFEGWNFLIGLELSY